MCEVSDRGRIGNLAEDEGHSEDEKFGGEHLIEPEYGAVASESEATGPGKKIEPAQGCNEFRLTEEGDGQQEVIRSNHYLEK